MTTSKVTFSGFWLQLAVISFLLLSTSVLFAAEPVGSVTFARGTAAAINGGQEPRILGKDSDVFVGDNIQTSARSFIIIKFNDGSKVTIRPNSNFTVINRGEADGKVSLDLSLHEGGIRASSDNTSKLSPSTLKIKTPSTTLNVQQADFSVRVCGNECQLEDDMIQKQVIKAERPVIARIVEVRGLVVAKNSKMNYKQERLLTIGAPLYSSDIINSEEDGYAVIVFKDKGRITLEQSSQFAITDYHFDEGDKEDSAFYKLFSGAMRVLTGSIGKKDHDAYSIDTPVATIGIRGTGFDLSFRENKLYSHVWKGRISQSNDAGARDLSSPDISLITSRSAIPKRVPRRELPDSGKVEAPRPDAVEVDDEPDLFKTEEFNDAPPGTYVEVHGGHVKVENEDGVVTDVGGNESSFTNEEGSKTSRSEDPASFMAEDPYPVPDKDFQEGGADSGASLLLDGARQQSDQDKFQCEIN